ncbi:MAG: DNA-binding response regulator [Mucilaginibacter sp.]|nr:DNA-binding response regulator [Mucilaginibacter sp.]
MKKLRCLIVDDEPVARKVLREFIAKIPFLEPAGEAVSVAKAEAFLAANATDLVLLDIEMPKRSGLDWLKQTTLKPMVILTTAFPNYALEGYELDIIDYLLKPIAFDRFQKAVQKAREYTELRHRAAPAALYACLFIRSEKRIEKVELSAILYIESTGNYVNVHTTEKKLVAYLTLKSLESQLTTAEFMKIHQSFIVNLAMITAIEGTLVMIGDKGVPVSRAYRDKLMQVVEQRLLRRT